MKRMLARHLRHLANRLDPDPIKSWSVKWSRHFPQTWDPSEVVPADTTHVDLQFRNGKRVVGYVNA